MRRGVWSVHSTGSVPFLIMVALTVPHGAGTSATSSHWLIGACHACPRGHALTTLTFGAAQKTNIEQLDGCAWKPRVLPANNDERGQL